MAIPVPNSLNAIPLLQVDMSLDTLTAVFVYGTLKTGQCRERCWPCEPLSVEKAWTAGELYDTGPYPALFRGDDLVGGELWTFPESSMALVLSELDAVEEYRPGNESTNLYNREIVTCTDQQYRNWTAYTYLYARPAERQFFQRLLPTYSWDERRFAVWPPAADW
ncbi:MAG: gamma-glutamylcyclotransferase [Pirellulaceae bacterium]|nr:gamma-glutamylcyclotransferase [Pirellulaceae bacterium]